MLTARSGPRAVVGATRRTLPGQPFGGGRFDGADGVVDDFEDADEAEAHAQAKEAPRVRHEGDDRDLLVAHDLRHHRLLDVDVDHRQILLGVLENVFFQAGQHQIGVCIIQAPSPVMEN